MVAKSAKFQQCKAENNIHKTPAKPPQMSPLPPVYMGMHLRVNPSPHMDRFHMQNTAIKALNSQLCRAANNLEKAPAYGLQQASHPSCVLTTSRAAHTCIPASVYG
ncbi:hypothetical protein GOP47_0014107 [Adiantum capillus-veneris]|uniref:Uncharacterized protein n=1 Tax=Adiantum capillus-veneris TaxID=13818 RepID=A0A9D4UQ08_ADICA|nr:hypothetical protein GOP47_0014107 [Adiantum capillus-veneris]